MAIIINRRLRSGGSVVRVDPKDVTCLERLTCTVEESVAAILSDAIARADFPHEVEEYIAASMANLAAALEILRLPETYATTSTNPGPTHSPKAT